jgi:hypothetical protein
MWCIPNFFSGLFMYIYIWQSIVVEDNPLLDKTCMSYEYDLIQRHVRNEVLTVGIPCFKQNRDTKK